MMTYRSTDELPEDRDGFRFRGGHIALDLTATLGARLAVVSHERLETADDLQRWLVSAGMADATLAIDHGDLDQARSLREAIYAIAMAMIEHGRPPSDAMDTLNRMAEIPAIVPQLTPDGGIRLKGNVAAALASIARDAVQLFGGPQRARLKQCQSEICSLLFLDISRRLDRRWCSMAKCGNKAKVAEFRQRTRRQG
jgi:predicted RNA-binding Zn ribbon-like protein